MADEVVGLRIEVDSNVGEAVGSLRSQLKAAQAEVAEMSEKFGVTSKEAAEAAKKAAELKDKIGDAKALTDAFNPDAKFKALSASLSGVAGGFAAVQGAMGLFGTESKDLEKQLLKVQSALALSQGLQSLGEAKDSFIALGAVIKNQVITAFSTLRGAIIATGIGALAIGLGLVVANFEAFKKAVYNLLPGLETVVKYIGGLVTKMTDFVGITSEADRQLEKLNKTTDKYGAQLEREIALLKARGDEVGAFNKQREKLEGDLAQARANYGKNNEKEWGKIILDTKNALEILKIEEQKYLAEQKKKRDEAYLARLEKEKQQKEKLEEEKRKLEEIQKNTEENLINNANRTRELQEKLRLTQIQDEKERAKVENEIKLQDELLAETERYKKGEVRLEQYLINISLIRKRYEEESKNQQEKESQEKLKNQSDKLLKDSELTDLSFNDRLAKIQERIALENQIVFASEEERTAFQKANSEARKKIVEEEANSKIEQAQRAADLLDGISNLIGKQTAAGKAAAVASTIINTYAAAQLAFKNAQLNPISILGSAYPYIQAGFAIAAGVKNVQQILSVPVPNGGGGGGGSVPSGGGYSFSSGGTAPISPQTNVVTTQLTNQNLNELKNNTVKAYVVESEMTDSQTRIRRIQQAAEFGD